MIINNVNFFHFCDQPIERKMKKFTPLHIPAKLQKELPFKSKPKLPSKQKQKSLQQRRAVVMEPDERKVYDHQVLISCI